MMLQRPTGRYATSVRSLRWVGSHSGCSAPHSTPTRLRRSRLLGSVPSGPAAAGQLITRGVPRQLQVFRWGPYLCPPSADTAGAQRLRRRYGLRRSPHWGAMFLPLATMRRVRAVMSCADLPGARRWVSHQPASIRSGTSSLAGRCAVVHPWAAQVQNRAANIQGGTRAGAVASGPEHRNVKRASRSLKRFRSGPDRWSRTPIWQCRNCRGYATQSVTTPRWARVIAETDIAAGTGPALATCV